MNKKTNEKLIEKKPRGRPTKYDPKFNDIAFTLSNKGIIEAEIFKILGIAEKNGIEWKKKYPNFRKAIEDGKKNKIQIAEDKLFKLVKGYRYKAEQVMVVSDGKDLGSHVEHVDVERTVEPNLRAIEYFLNNRKPRSKYPEDGWGEKIELEHSGNIGYKVIPDEIEGEKE